MPTAVAPFQLATRPGDGTTNSTCHVSDWVNNTSIRHFVGQFSILEWYYTESKAFTVYIVSALPEILHMMHAIASIMLKQHAEQQLTLKDSHRLAERVMFMTAPAQST